MQTLPSQLSAAVPLLVSVAMAIASLGLACSIFGLALVRLPAHSSCRACVFSIKNSKWLRTPLKLASCSLWFSVTALHVLAWHLCLFDSAQGELYRFSYVSTLIAILLGWQLWNSVSRRQLSSARVLTMQVFQIAGLVCCAQFYPSIQSDSVIAGPPGRLVVARTVVTDLGTHIPVYERKINTRELEAFYRQTQGQVASLARFAMLKSEAQSHVNCHGWVFSGQHIIKGEDVPTILKENNYETVTAPQLNDLVIYKDESGLVVHTGQVCGFLGDDQPLIESKWGIAGTYVHLASEQPYSAQYEFYRSPRSGHHLSYCEPPKPKGNSPG